MGLPSFLHMVTALNITTLPEENRRKKAAAHYCPFLRLLFHHAPPHFPPYSHARQESQKYVKEKHVAAVSVLFCY